MEPATPVSLDTKDRQLIEALRVDARSTIRDLAKQTNMRPSTVHSRMKRLLERGVVEHYTVKLNHLLMGEGLAVFVLATTEGTIPAKVFNNPHVKEVFGITGEYDLLLKLRVANLEEFNRFILEFRDLPQVKKTHTMVGTIHLKEGL